MAAKLWSCRIDQLVHWVADDWWASHPDISLWSSLQSCMRILWSRSVVVFSAGTSCSLRRQRSVSALVNWQSFPRSHHRRWSVRCVTKCYWALRWKCRVHECRCCWEPCWSLTTALWCSGTLLHTLLLLDRQLHYFHSGLDCLHEDLRVTTSLGTRSLRLSWSLLLPPRQAARSRNLLWWSWALTCEVASSQSFNRLYEMCFLVSDSDCLPNSYQYPPSSTRFVVVKDSADFWGTWGTFLSRWIPSWSQGSILVSPRRT